MEWMNIEQTKRYLEPTEENTLKGCGTLYKDHLVILKQPIIDPFKQPPLDPKTKLCFFNLRINFMIFVRPKFDF